MINKTALGKALGVTVVVTCAMIGAATDNPLWLTPAIPLFAYIAYHLFDDNPFG